MRSTTPRRPMWPPATWSCKGTWWAWPARPIAANTPGSLAVAGVFDFPKATGAGSGIAAGTKVYWDATNKVATATAARPTSTWARRPRLRPTPTPRSVCV